MGARSNHLRHETREKFAAALFAAHVQSTKAIGRCGTEQDDGSFVISRVVWRAINAWADQEYDDIHEDEQCYYIVEADAALLPILDPLLAEIDKLEGQLEHWETWE